MYITIIIICSALCWYFWKVAKKYKHFPSPMTDVRLMFNILIGRFPKTREFGSYAFCLTMDLCKKFQEEGLFFAWFLQPIVLVFHEKYVKVLLNNAGVVDKPIHFRILSDASGKGLVIHSEPLWHQRRKLLNPAFSLEILKNQMPLFNSVGRTLANMLLEAKNNPNVDVLTIIKTHALKIIFASLLDVQGNGNHSEQTFWEVSKAISRLEYITEYRFHRPWLFWKQTAFLLSSEMRKSQKAYKDLHNFVKDTLEEMMRSRSSYKPEEDGSECVPRNPKSFAHLLLQNHLIDRSFTLDDAEQELKTFILGGHDSVSNTILWCLFMIAIHPEIQERAFEEVNMVTGGEDVDITYNDLNNLSYIEAIIKETLRLFPSFPLIGRHTSEDIEFETYKIPKNTTVFFNIYLLHRSPEVYPDPEKFDPERFYNNSLKHPWAFVPFGEGLRNCIGKNFAMMEIKVLLFHILRRLKITSLDKKEDVTVDYRVVLTPVKPIRISFTSR